MQRDGIRRAIIGLLILVPGLAGGWIMRDHAPVSGARLFSQVIQLVDANAVEALSEDELYERAARGLIERLDDDYADLYSPEQLATFTREQLGSAYGGLGMQIEDQQGAVTVSRVFPSTPAERGGVRAGDRVLSVDGVSTQGLKLEEVSNRLLGKAGTTVDVAFGRAGMDEPITGQYTRAVVHIPAVPYAVVLDGGVGYIPLQRFNETASADVRKAVLELKAQGARSYVVDVRGNGGGSLEEALNISNLFLEPGLEISRVEYRDREPDIYTARGMTILPEAPMVVLTDEYSASASEIVAGALQDHDRAVIVGEASFGKGLVQQIFPLDEGWAMKLTTGKWYTPSGRSIQRDRAEDGAPIVPDAASVQVFRSASGRPIEGAGGITPDLLVNPDTISTLEQEFSVVVGQKGREVYVAIYDQALAVKDDVTPDFEVSTAWRDELFERLKTAEVPITREQYDSARPLIDRLLEQRVAGLAFGDSASFRRFAPYDAQLRAALELLREGTSQQELFAILEKQ